MRMGAGRAYVFGGDRKKNHENEDCSQLDLASRAAVGILRCTTWRQGSTSHTARIRRALEAAGVDFIDENGGGPGVRLRKADTSTKRN
jgi:hypothetical protein